MTTAPGTRLTGLWRNPEFLKRWAGQSASLAGPPVTRLALPLTAVLLLDATPAQTALLQAVEAIPHLTLGFVAGLWVARPQRRPIMIWVALGRAAGRACR